MPEYKKWLIVFGSAVLFVFLFWFGYELFTINAMNAFGLFLVGCGCAATGLYMAVTAQDVLRLVGIVLVLAAFYFFARMAGFITTSWMGKLLGIASMFAAILVVYVAVTFVQKQGSPE